MRVEPENNFASASVEACQLSAIPGKDGAGVVPLESGEREGFAIQLLQRLQACPDLDAAGEAPLRWPAGADAGEVGVGGVLPREIEFWPSAVRGLQHRAGLGLAFADLDLRALHAFAETFLQHGFAGDAVDIAAGVAGDDAALRERGAAEYQQDSQDRPSCRFSHARLAGFRIILRSRRGFLRALPLEFALAIYLPATAEEQQIALDELTPK